MMMWWERLNRHAYLVATLVFVATLAVYIRTLMQGTVGGDAGELQYAAPLLALVHPTGQPIYVLLGKLWTTILPLKTAAYEMNLLSATSTALGCAFVTWFTHRLYRNLPIALVSGVMLGFGATIWGQAVIADKYGFNVLLATLIVGLTLWWDRDYDKHHGDKLLYTLSFTFALGILHHRSLLLFAVGIGILVIYRLRADLLHQWRRTLICIAIVLIPPLLIYPTVLPLLESRELTPLLWQPNGASDWVDFLLERHVLSGEALVFDSGIGDQLKIYFDTVINDYTIAILPIALIGIIAMLQRSLGAFLFLTVSYLLQAILSANFRGNDRQFTYYLPSFVVMIYAFAYGLSAVWNTFQHGITKYFSRNQQNLAGKAPSPNAELGKRNLFRRDYRVRALSIIATTLIAIIPILQFLDSYPDRREESLYGETLTIWRETLKTGDMGERLTAGVPDLPENAVLASDWEQVTILWYNQQVENIREDIEILYPIERYADFVDSNRPVCITRNFPVDAAWHLSNTGALICLNDDPQTQLPQNMTPINAVFLQDGTPYIELAGVQITGDSFPAGTHIPLNLVWRAMTDLDQDYSISLQILDENWTPIWQRDIQSPVMGMYPTSRWVEGEVISDYHEISLPRPTPAGQYRWSIVLYRQNEDGAFISLQDAGGNANIIGGTIEITSG